MRQTPPNRETASETPARQQSLKALARKALQRDSTRDASETSRPEHARHPRDEPDAIDAMRARLLALAREVGIPDRIVLELPARELEATRDQLPLWPDADLQRRVLVFYLRGLAGIEPALPGSLAARRTTPDPPPMEKTR